MVDLPGLSEILFAVSPRKGSLILTTEKKKFKYYSAIIEALQKLGKVARTSYINRTELECCLLSRSTLCCLIKLLPTSEYDMWVREMTVAGLDFRNPTGPETFACFKKICVIDPKPKLGTQAKA